jgi:hypothetical protein
VIPSFLTLTLLVLAAYRTWKLIAEDTILDRPRKALIAWVDQSGRGGTAAHRRAMYVALFIECPWCAGFWISLAWWGAWQAWPHGTLVAAGPMAISAIVGILGWGVSS